MDSASLLDTVTAVIREQMATPEAVIEPGTPLGADGLGIDSVGCLELVLELERRTGLALRDEHLTAEALATPAGLVELLEQAGQS
ncbi:MAG: hypothetical protein RLZZ440_1942 [Planctomycetota bacterium]|jgi:acyl carrier protein